MKAMTLKLTFAAVLITGLSVNARADIEIASVLAANIQAVGMEMDQVNDRVIDQVSTDYSEQLINDLDNRLLMEFGQLTSSVE